jgi:hypothetical protein
MAVVPDFGAPMMKKSGRRCERLGRVVAGDVVSTFRSAERTGSAVLESRNGRELANSESCFLSAYHIYVIELS